MTYCLGVRLPAGLVLASDSRTNAGVDQIATVRKLALYEDPGRAVFALLSAGNLATTQAVVTILRQNIGTGLAGRDLLTLPGMFEAAQTVGAVLREVLARDGDHVRPFGDPGGSFLLGGQVRGEPPRLFQIYTAGNFVETTPRSPFLQIGENKYGKPILDRAIRADTELYDALKLGLISMDSTMRSNLSVGMPLDLLVCRRGALQSELSYRVDETDTYFRDLRHRWSEALSAAHRAIPLPPYGGGGPAGLDTQNNR